MIKGFWRERLACLLLAGLLACSFPGALAETVLLTAAGNQAMEARLLELGFFSGKPDGVWDQDTEVALGNFQQANSMVKTGELDEETAQALRGGDAVSKQAFLNAIVQRYLGVELTLGDVSWKVSALQERLSALGYYQGEVNGVFGEDTGEAVCLFQRAVCLNVTGVADGATLYRLIEGDPPRMDSFLASASARKGEAGKAVRQLQDRLRELGYFAGQCTGTYGELTAQAVSAFQKVSGLEATGTADEATCAALYSPGARSFPWEEELRERLGTSLAEAQRRLSRLGYYQGEPTGQMDVPTRIALSLYEIANGLPLEEAARVEEDAVTSAEAQAVFSESRRDMSEEARKRIAGEAEGLLGRAFEAEDREMYRGFAFVQYVYSLSGVAFTDPGEILEAADVAGEGGALEPGAIVLLERGGEGTSLLMAVSLGGGRLAFPDESGRWIVACAMEQMEYQKAYVWRAEAEHV